jgi:hypothetical protein
MAPYTYRPASQAARRSRRVAENHVSHPGRSLQALETELMALQQELQRLYTDIQRAKSAWSLLYFLLYPPLRSRQLQEVAALRTRIQRTLDRMRDLKEQQVGLLFLDCWSEELAAVPASLLLGEPPDVQQQATPVTEGERHDA